MSLLPPVRTCWCESQWFPGLKSETWGTPDLWWREQNGAACDGEADPLRCDKQESNDKTRARQRRSKGNGSGAAWNLVLRFPLDIQVMSRVHLNAK